MRQATILVVEDDLHAQELAAFFLEYAGYRVLLAGEAGEGIRLAEQHLPDLILMDLSLPGIGGLEAAGTLRRKAATAGIPILAFTAHAREEDTGRALAAGCNGCVTKPFEKDGLLEAVARWTVPADGDGRP